MPGDSIGVIIGLKNYWNMVGPRTTDHASVLPQSHTPSMGNAGTQRTIFGTSFRA